MSVRSSYAETKLLFIHFLLRNIPLYNNIHPTVTLCCLRSLPIDSLSLHTSSHPIQHHSQSLFFLLFSSTFQFNIFHGVLCYSIHTKCPYHRRCFSCIVLFLLFLLLIKSHLMQVLHFAIKIEWLQNFNILVNTYATKIYGSSYKEMAWEFCNRPWGLILVRKKMMIFCREGKKLWNSQEPISVWYHKVLFTLTLIFQ